MVFNRIKKILRHPKRQLDILDSFETSSEDSSSSSSSSDKGIVDQQPAPPRNGLVVSVEEATQVETGSTDDMDNQSSSAAAVKISMLDSGETTKLLSRVKDITQAQTEEFHMRDKTVPAPRPSQTVDVSFPPVENLPIPSQVKEDLECEATKPLTVLRHLPDGNLDRVCPHLSITFSQPMIDLSSVENQENEFIPAQITPSNIEGRWRWIGTKTLHFEPEHRFNMSTNYKVTVPKGTLSKTNQNPLQEDYTFSFSTPPLSVRRFYPTSSHHHRNEMIGFVEFDQKIDPQAVLPFISISQGKSVKILSKHQVEEWIKSHEEYQKKFSSHYQMMKSYLSNAIDEQHLFFQIQEELSLGTSYTVSINKGAPSAEGSRTTETVQSRQFSTYGTFGFDYQYPRVDSNTLPYNILSITLTNGIDKSSFNIERDITIEPVIENVKYSISGRTITIHGSTKARTTYHVRLSGEFKDIYGQTYSSANHTCKFTIRGAATEMRLLHDDHFLIDTTANDGSKLDLLTVGYSSLKMFVYQVEPHMYPNYVNARQPYQGTRFEYSGIDEKYCVSKQTIKINMTSADDPILTQIDVTKHLQHPIENLGQLVVVLENNQHHPQRIRTWFQCTKIALDVFQDRSYDTFCWATSLESGASLTDVEFSSFKRNGEILSLKQSTNEQGVAKLASNGFGDNFYVVAKRGNDVAFSGQLYVSSPVCSHVRTHVFDDRKLYKPNETVYIKGFVRELSRDENPATYTLKIPGESNIPYTVTDARGAKIVGSFTKLENGSFDFTFKIPDNVNLGEAHIRFDGLCSLYTHTFKIQEFRTPEYKVSTSVPPNNYIVNSKAVVTVDAQYYSGGGLSNADVQYVVKQTPSSYTPPNWWQYKFDSNKPSYFWWFTNSIPDAEGTVKFNGKTDTNGQHQIAIKFDENDTRKKKVPVRITTDVTVVDINRQTISSSTSFLVHSSSLYVGVKSNQSFLIPGQKYKSNVIVSNINGEAVPEIPVKIVIKRVEKVKKGCDYINQEVTEVDRMYHSQAEPLELEFDLKQGGIYNMFATVKDDQGREHCSSNHFIVQGAQLPHENLTSSITPDKVTVIANQKKYRPGETAKILVQSPYPKACEAFYFVLCDLIVKQERIQLDKYGSAVVELELNDVHIPNFSFKIFVASSTARSDAFGLPVSDPSIPNRPAYATGETQISVSTEKHELKVEVTPENQFNQPGSEVNVDVQVNQHDGSPCANAEVTLVAVDEAVLSLTGYSIPHPIHSFLIPHAISFRHEENRHRVYLRNVSNVTLSEPLPPPCPPPSCAPVLMSSMALKCAPAKKMKRCRRMKETFKESDAFVEEEEENDEASSEGGTQEEAESEITLRSNFSPIAAFLPNLKTDENGKLRSKITLPDNLTRFRLTAVVVAESNKFGLGDSFVVARLPLALRPSLPRFLNFGDTNVECCVVLQNQTGGDAEVNVAVRLSNLKLVDEKKNGYIVSLSDNQRCELRFPVNTESSGAARFQIVAAVKGTNLCDASEVQINVWTPATTEGTATYGEIDAGAIAQTVRPPGKVFPQFGSLDISTTSTALASLTDCFLYLYEYKFECSEQRASRALSVLAVRDLLDAFNPKLMPSRVQLNANLEKTFKGLSEMQRSDGSYGFWHDSRLNSLFCTNHVAMAFVDAVNEGVSVNPNSYQKLIKFISRMEIHANRSTNSVVCRLAYRAFSVFVLSCMKDKIVVNNKIIANQASEIYSESGGTGKNCLLSLESLAWIAIALYRANGSKTDEVNAIMKEFSNRVNETAETVNFVSEYNDAGESKLLLLHSNHRTDAIILDAFMEIDPKNNIIPKVVKGLQAHRVKGRWGNTQENIWVLLAMRKYFRLFENVEPDFIARSWLGNDFCGETKFKGRSSETQVIRVPMKMLVGDDEESESKVLLLHKEGKGRLYYRLGMNYALRDLSPPAASYGFTVCRSYESVNGNKSVKRLDDGRWKFKAGELVRVRLTLENASVRYHVALVDKLPAGLEPLNPDLKGTPKEGRIGGGKSSRHSNWWSYWGPWYEHYNIRDERVEAFSTHLYAGSHEFTYVARATSLGEFVAPPLYVEEMYEPSLFARSTVDRCIVTYDME